ncbi:MAG: SseB family protein [Micrococcales bacterium]|nr:SseB family protein [Micrococcales bacterium]
MPVPPQPGDSAGVPWAGRSFEPNPASDDDGSADARLLEALLRFRARELGQPDVLDALRTARVLVPLVAGPGREGPGPAGHRIDTSQELSLVTVAAPDGRRVLPAFTSVATLRAWDPAARPIPVDARRVAVAAAGEGTDLVVLDPASATEFALRRGALRALAMDEPWVAPADDPRVAASVDRAVAGELDVLAARALPGDPDARLSGPDLIVAVVLRGGLDGEAQQRVLARLAEDWRSEEALAELVDSIAVSLVSV